MPASGEKKYNNYLKKLNKAKHTVALDSLILHFIVVLQTETAALLVHKNDGESLKQFRKHLAHVCKLLWCYRACSQV